jgi:trans-2,3-dihydro-3-hydroxyanthranilate isomerase
MSAGANELARERRSEQPVPSAGANELAYEVIDVFTDTPYAGNPLAVVLEGEHLSTSQMQQLAREFNLSETVFPLAPPQGASYRLRIFTPTKELPFAGHPSVGAAWLLHQLGRIDAGDNVQACGAGLLPVHVTADAVTLTGGTPTVSEPLAPGPCVGALGLGELDLAGPAPRWAGVGIEFAFVLVRGASLAAVELDIAAVARLGGSGIALVEWDGFAARVRVFPGGVGITEDPATGSAALGLGVYLAAVGLLPDGSHTYTVTQGVEMGRPSTLVCTVDVVDGVATRTTVTGSAVRVAKGVIRVP